VMSGIGFFWFFQVIYGTPNPSVVYAGSPSLRLSVASLSRGVPGLLFDQQFGLIPNAPVYLCAFAGLVLMFWRGPRRLALELLLIAVPYFLVAASFTSWWGGTTPPARYFVPITPLLAVPAACWFATARSVAARTSGLAALLISLLMTATFAFVDRGAFVFNFRDGRSRVAAWLSPVVDLTRAVPSLFQNPPGTVLLQTVIWLLALAFAVAVASMLNRRGRAAVVVGFGLALEAAAMVAVSLVWQSNHGAVATPYASGPAVLHHYDLQANQIAFAYRPFHRLALVEVPSRMVLASALSAGGGQAAATAVHLPAGIYELTGTAAAAASGGLRLKVDHLSSTPIASWDVATLRSNWTQQVMLPVAVASLEIDADADARRALRDVSLRAVSRSDPQDALAGREAKDGARYGSLVVFLMRGDAWVEPAGIWVAGGSHADFALAPDRQAPVHLAVRNGPVDNQVTLESGSWRQEMALKPGEERIVLIAPYGRTDGTPLSVAATNGFHPSDGDPKNADERFLGVRLEVR
jgi:hypothetical protein